MQTEGLFSKTDVNGECAPWEDMKAQTYELGLGEPIGVSAEHGDGLLDIFDVLYPYGDLLDLRKKEDRERYEASQLQIPTDVQPYDIRLNVDVVSSYFRS